VGQRANLTFTTHQKHGHTRGVRAPHLAFREVSVSQHWHEFSGHLLRSSVIYPDLLTENQMAAEVSRST
jgi:hypothetical protein